MSNTTENREIYFEPCVGACCQDSRLILDTDEAEHLLEAGTNLRVAFSEYILHNLFDASKKTDLRPEALRELYRTLEADDPLREKLLDIMDTLLNLKDDDEYYEIIGRCGYLSDQNECTDYDARPRVCRGFQAGGIACMSFRKRAGLDRHEDETPLPYPTRR